MIVWGTPAALFGVLLLAAPILIHMLLRRHARRVLFPTTRFLIRTSAAAVRFGRPSDVALLAVRLAIVAAAAMAAAHPVLRAGWRSKRWNARTARAVVVDTSRSMGGGGGSDRLAAQELQTFMSVRFAQSDVADGVRRASEWLTGTPPARRELVIVSDFQRGALDADTFSQVPSGIGIRFVRVASDAQPRTVQLPPIAGWRGGEWRPEMTLRGETLDASWTRTGTSRPASVTTRQPPADDDAAARAVTAGESFGVAAQGVPARAAVRCIVAFAGAAPIAGEHDIQTPAVAAVALALRQHPLLQESGARATLAELGGALVVHTNVSAAAPAAPAVVRAAMLAARPVEIADRESEPAMLPDAVLARWTRAAAPVSPADWRRLENGGDARWLWAAAIGLMAIEQWMRTRRARAAVKEIHAHAA